MRLWVPPSQPLSQSATTDVASLERGDLSRLLGSNAAAQDAPEAPSATVEFGSRLRLAGVAAPIGPGGAGLAIISVDGNPPRVYRVGAVIDTSMVLHEVNSHSATIVAAHGGVGQEVVLEMQPLAAAQTGVPPSRATANVYGETSTTQDDQPSGTDSEGLDAVPVAEPPSVGRLPRGQRAR